MPSEPQHLLMRFSDRLFRVGDVIEQHDRILSEQGRVWMAKLGRPVGVPRINLICRQIAEGEPTYVFLAQSTRRGLDAYRAELLTIQRDAPPADERDATPPYYKRLDYFTTSKTWMCLRTIEHMDPHQLDEVCVTSSRQSGRRVLQTSMNSLFIVQYRTETALPYLYPAP